MAVDIIMVRQPQGFVPLTDYDREEAEKYPIGTQVNARLTKPKSNKLMRFYWGLVNNVANGIGRTKDNLSDELLVNTGFAYSIVIFGEGVRLTPKSIAKMDHTELVAATNAVIELLLQKYIPHMRRAELINEVEAMLGISYADAVNKGG